MPRGYSMNRKKVRLADMLQVLKQTEDLIPMFTRTNKKREPPQTFTKEQYDDMFKVLRVFNDPNLPPSAWMSKCIAEWNRFSLQVLGLDPNPTEDQFFSKVNNFRIEYQKLTNPNFKPQGA